MGDQGTRGLESRGMPNTRRMSEARQSSHEEKQNPQAESSTTEGKTQPNYPSQEHLAIPTNMDATPGASTPTPAISRASSTASDYFSRQRVRRVEPPVTRSTLSELDVNKIIHNPKLRHDINFDPELHFRPNLDGEKGKRKQDKANHFWTALKEQIALFVGDRDEFLSRYGEGNDWCLPLLLKSVKDIIQTLVPARDRMYLDEGLNVDLIMQQFHKGMADLEKLASWLSGVLKSHCAPMRDEWVDEMYSQLTNGNRTNNIEELVQGMRSLLSVLEAMKLDVANHQIRCLRPALIEDTVHFERRFFMKKMRDNKLDQGPAQSWYLHMAQGPLQDSASQQAFGEMAYFFESLSRMILPSDNANYPNTFLFDEERMFKLRSDMFDAINLEVCMRLYDQLEKSYKNSEGANSLMGPSPESLAYLDSRLDDEAETDTGYPRCNSAQSKRSSLVLSSAGSAHSSPRSSLVLGQSSSEAMPSFISAEEQRTRSRSLYSSLVALLQSTPATVQPAQRWHVLKESLALQIFRFTNAPVHVLKHFEDSMDRHLSQFNSPLFQEVERCYQRQLLTELQHRVREFKSLSGVSLFSVATGGRLQGPGRTWDAREQSHSSSGSNGSNLRDRDLAVGREEGSIEDMATRLTHLGILHWRVWADLVYLTDPDPDTDMSTEEVPTLKT